MSDLALIEFMAPVTLGSRLIFQVLSDGLPVGYARLERDPSTVAAPGIAQLFSPPIHKDYVLKTIQVHHQFRRRGIGSRLLQEVARYCREHQIERLSCSLEGNALLLRRWYLRNGFTSRDDNTLELALS
ncbi:MAG: GNAT family N-acetyltransferase [Pseudomonadota bacterium]